MTGCCAIYSGFVVHQRVRPRRHRLRYRVFNMLLDLDEVAALDRRHRLFGYNRWAPLSFHDRDHGPTDGTPLRPWVEARLAEARVQTDGGPIRLLCYPRVFGHAFNPLSVYFCHRRDGTLAAILYEVCNTFHERHTYVIPVSQDGDGPVRQHCRKALYVSPFIAMDADYFFHVVPPGPEVAVVIREEDQDGLVLAAAFRGWRSPITDRSLVEALVGHPLLGLKVVGGIHWEALRLWLKGLRPHPRVPAAAPVQSSIRGAGGCDA